MEFHEKIQELRKSRGLTQEELARALFVSRTAVSKWESGRGYPSIESLKDIANYFSVTVDELISGEKILSIAQRENKSRFRKLCASLFGITDLFSLMLIIFPLYPNAVDGYIYSVNLFAYAQTTAFNRVICWVLFGGMVALGIAEIILAKWAAQKRRWVVMCLSLAVNIFTVIFLALAREAYAVTVAFALLMVKAILIFKSEKNSG